MTKVFVDPVALSTGSYSNTVDLLDLLKAGPEGLKKMSEIAENHVTFMRRQNWCAVPEFTRPQGGMIGAQAVFKFKNGFGASVIYGPLTNSYPNRFELGLVVFEKDDSNYHLYYNDIVDGDVVGHLNVEGVNDYLRKICQMTDDVDAALALAADNRKAYQKLVQEIREMSPDSILAKPDDETGNF